MGIDAARAADEIEEFVRSEVTRLRKRGVVLGLSGGLDSSVCAYLCVRALGRKRVLVFSLPERDSDPQNIRDADLVAQTQGLRLTRIDLSPILAQLGVYGLVSSRFAGDRRAIEGMLNWIAVLTRRPSAFAQGMALLYNSRPGPWTRLIYRLLWRSAGRIRAFAITKVRLRMLVLYYHAMVNDCLVVGTTDKSEWTLGFYDKYGDGANDISLLRHLYKTQIRQLARHVGVPPQIVNKPSSADLAAGLPNQSLIGLSYERLDRILWCIEQGLPDEKIGTQAGVTPSAIRAIHKAMGAAQIYEALPSHL